MHHGYMAIESSEGLEDIVSKIAIAHATITIKKVPRLLQNN